MRAYSNQGSVGDHNLHHIILKDLRYAYPPDLILSGNLIYDHMRLF